MKKYLKSYIVIICLLTLSLLLTACTNGSKQQGYVLPDLTGKTIENYKETLTSPLITIVEKKEYHSSIPLNQFTRYGNNQSAGTEVTAGTMIYVYFSQGPQIVKQPDSENPQIVGAEDKEIYFASTFNPLEGVTVTDNVDNDLLNRLIVTGSINPLKLGQQKITYSVMDRSGNLAELVRTITVIPTEIDTRYTDSLTFNKGYEGKNFITDGIGLATLTGCVDGDTAHFNVSGQRITVRFLGINTPESTYKFEPWGKPASRFTCDKLTNANTIVLEREGEVFDTTGTRYLAWVWVDGRLLNLEIVEQAYSTSTGATGSQYGQLFYDADVKTQGTKKRIWGESDPEHDYSLEGSQITIEELRTNYEEYLGKKVSIRGIISRKIGANAFIEQNGFGVYVYVGYTYTTKVEPGNEVVLSGVIATLFNDSLQVSNYSTDKATVVSTGNPLTPKLLTIDQLNDDYSGTLTEFKNLTITQVPSGPDQNGSYDITVRDQSGKTITLRYDGSVFPTINLTTFKVGDTLDIIAPLGKYYEDYQLMIASINDITFH